MYENQNELTAFLRSEDRDNLTEKYELFIQNYMSACDGHSCERIADMINSFMEEAEHE